MGSAGSPPPGHLLHTHLEGPRQALQIGDAHVLLVDGQQTLA